MSPSFYVVNTHLQAAYDFDDQHSDVRRAQLEQLMAYVNTLPANVPVVLIGDLNIVGGSTEYQDRLGDVLAGFVDPVAAAFGNAAMPFTNDKTRNAYGHFWKDEHHILEHELEDIAVAQGSAVCLAIATPFGLPGACAPPIPHPTDRNRLDHILIRQGTEYQLEVTGVQMEDVSAGTDLCRNRFQAQFSDPGHGTISCYMSDHFGLSATLRLRRP